MNYIIYRHTSPSGKVYIGQTCQKAEHRWNSGKNYAHYSFPPLRNMAGII